MEKLKDRLANLIQHFQIKAKIFLAKCNDRHPVIFKITLAVLSAISFMVLFVVLFGWGFWFSCEAAAVLMPVIYVHEYGHVWAMKKCGMTVTGVFFIPFMGAATFSEDNTDINQTPSHTAQAFTYIMGPVAGLVLAAVAAGAYLLTGLQIFANVVIWSAILNIFNLAPLMPLDGGGVVKAISSSIRPWLGLGLMSAAIIAAFVLSIFYIHGWINWLFVYLILYLAARDFRRELAMRNNTDRRPMTWKMILVFLLAYFATIAALCGIVYLTVKF